MNKRNLPMSWSTLTSSTAKPVSFSGGASSRVSTMHLDPVPPLLQFETRHGEHLGQHFLLPLVRAPMRPMVWLGVHQFGDVDVLELSEAEMQRLACHVLVHRL